METIKSLNAREAQIQRELGKMLREGKKFKPEYEQKRQQLINLQRKMYAR